MLLGTEAAMHCTPLPQHCSEPERDKPSCFL